MLSHSHPDHTGGLPTLLERRTGLPVHAHPDILRPRYSEKGGVKSLKGLPWSQEALEQRAELRLSESPERVLPDVWTSGEIVERDEPEGRSPHHLVRHGEGWAPDPYRDDLSLVLETGAGLFVVCGCCHAGLLNTLTHVRRHFGEDPVGVIGGTHLVGAGPAQLAHTVIGSGSSTRRSSTSTIAPARPPSWPCPGPSGRGSSTARPGRHWSSSRTPRVGKILHEVWRMTLPRALRPRSFPADPSDASLQG